jgi:hypothetical protein
MRRFFCLTIAAGMAALLAGPVGAEGLRDRVYADSFGNLVIHSPAGYKRIIIGQGEVADSYNLTGSYYEPEDPKVVYLDRSAGERRTLRCARGPHVWHGRSHMYGLSLGEAPMAPLVCR